MSKKDSLFHLEPEDKKMINSVTWRTMIGSGPYQYEKMQGLTFLYAMVPVIERYYKKKEDKVEAYKRHWEIWNTTPQMAGLATGLAASMEKQASEDPNYDTKSINAVKASLMGPLASIGDSVFWGTLKIIATGIGVSFAAAGSILGPILYFLIYNIPATFVRHILPVIGFISGENFLKKASENGTIPLLTQYASMIGLMTIGAMACTMVSISIPFTYNVKDVSFTVQSIIDSIAPAILPTGLTLLCMNILKKGKVAPAVLIIILVIASIILHCFGIL